MTEYATYKVWDGCKAPANLEYNGYLVGQIVPGDEIAGKVCELEGIGEGELCSPIVDIDALLDEAKEAEKCAWYFALDHDEDELRDRLTEAAEDFSGMARRILEAVGE